jgi:DNA-binding MarR family transcriptional regulator/N-acetylglutamate synthase-like GNAT family acetyltransferase
MLENSFLDVAAVRGFNRFYTSRIGVLEEGLLASPFTLAQARVLFELGTRHGVSAGQISALLGLDAGYLSRILQSFFELGLLKRERSAEDGRRAQLSLTAKGRTAFAAMDEKSRRAIGQMIAPLSALQRQDLLAAMRTVQQMLSGDEAGGPTHSWHDGVEGGVANVVIRPYGIGDVGWAIERHGRLYADEFGWNGEFEALVATLFARFAAGHDPEAEQFWVAELEGERVGCVFMVRNDKDPRAAQLRCLLVDPRGRGHGIGGRLVDQCLNFARAAGYDRIMLWTNDVLVGARTIYEKAGFALVEQAPHRSFGKELVGQIWERPL